MQAEAFPFWVLFCWFFFSSQRDCLGANLAVLYLVVICSYFLTVAVSLVSHLLFFSLTSACNHSSLVEGDWLNL